MLSKLVSYLAASTAAAVCLGHTDAAQDDSTVIPLSSSGILPSSIHNVICMFMKNLHILYNRTAIHIYPGSRNPSNVSYCPCFGLISHASPVLHRPLRSPRRFQGVIDAAAEVDIRVALLTVADGGDDRKKDPLAVFARTDNAESTCATSGTAGADGLATCVERCERKPSTWDLRVPRGGACYTLCTLAISPCTQG